MATKRETPQEMPLPADATAVTPRTVETGNWVPMEIDAELEFGGITWLRAKGGFGGDRYPGESMHPREDWIADLPAVAVHVGRWLRNPDDWKGDGATMEEAMLRAIGRALVYTEHEIAECSQRLIDLNTSLLMLRKGESDARPV